MIPYSFFGYLYPEVGRGISNFINEITYTSVFPLIDSSWCNPHHCRCLFLALACRSKTKTKNQGVTLVEATIKEYRAADIKGTKDDRDTSYRNAVKASKLRLEVEARLGELLNEQIQHKGGRPTKNSSIRGTVLKDIGLTKKDSHRAQQIARLTTNGDVVSDDEDGLVSQQLTIVNWRDSHFHALPD